MFCSSQKKLKYLLLQETTFKDGDGDIPTQEVGTALRALGTYPSVGTLHWFYYFKYFLQEQELQSKMRNIEELDMEQFMSILLR